MEDYKYQLIMQKMNRLVKENNKSISNIKYTTNKTELIINHLNKMAVEDNRDEYYKKINMSYHLDDSDDDDDCKKSKMNFKIINPYKSYQGTDFVNINKQIKKLSTYDSKLADEIKTVTKQDYKEVTSKEFNDSVNKINNFLDKTDIK